MKIARKIVALAIVGTGVVSLGGVANAHNAYASPDCNGLDVTWDNYFEGYDLSVTIDGGTTTFDVAGNGARFFPWSDAAGHSYSVYSEFHQSVIGSGQTEPCVEETTTTSTTTTILETITVPDVTKTVPAPTTTTPVVGTTTPAVVVVDQPIVIVEETPVVVAEEEVTTTTVRQTLPATGKASRIIVLVGIIIYLAGIILWFVARNKVKQIS